MYCFTCMHFNLCKWYLLYIFFSLLYFFFSQHFVCKSHPCSLYASNLMLLTGTLHSRMYIHHILPLHFPRNEHSNSCQFPASLGIDAGNIFVHVPIWTHVKIHVEYIPGRELLAYKICVFIIRLSCARLLSRMTAPALTPTSSEGEFVPFYPHPFQSLAISKFLCFFLSAWEMWSNSPVNILICISPIMNDLCLY